MSRVLFAEIAEEELPAALRRQEPFPWPDFIEEASFAAGAFLDSLEVTPLVAGLASDQSYSSTQGAFALSEKLEAILKEVTQFPYYVWAAQSAAEAEFLANIIVQRWQHLRPAAQLGEQVQILARAEVASFPSPETNPRMVLIAEDIRQEMGSLLVAQGATVRFSPWAVEVLGSALVPTLATLKSMEAMCGLMAVRLTWLASGFQPESAGFDWAVIDLSEFLEKDASLWVLAVRAEGEPFLPQPRWRHTAEGWSRPADRLLSSGWWPDAREFLPELAHLYTVLRHLGALGLRNHARRVALRCTYLRDRLRVRLGPDQVYGHWLHVRAFPAKQCFVLRGDESLEVLDRMVEEAVRAKVPNKLRQQGLGL
jgi:hypothetical protein